MVTSSSFEPSSLKKFSAKRLSRIIEDPEASARAVKLVYVNDRQEGILRTRSGKSFSYSFKNRRVRDKATLARIRSLVLPPAWEKVWICASENGHLQATGYDARGRKQYRYHPLWNQLRNHTKFYRMIAFGKALPAMRRRLRKDMAGKEMTREKVLATIVALMEQTSIRIGNEEYEKENGSIGLTTMKNRHVSVARGALRFSFVGKKGREHLISFRNKRLATIVRHCREIPGRELFQYYDAEGKRQPVDSGMVNDYIREISGQDFTAKDFRTWAGTLHCLVALKELGPAASATDARRQFVEVLDRVAAHLGNTRSVCRKYYVHPCLEPMYESSELLPYLQQIGGKTPAPGQVTLSAAEKTVLRILRKAA